MTESIHNPDQYMAALRTIVAQGRKRIGFLVGAGAPAGMAKEDGSRPLIPAVEGLTKDVLSALDKTHGPTITALKAGLPSHDIESILSRVRALSNVLGKDKVHGLDGDAYHKLGQSICTEIGKFVDAALPQTTNAYSDLVNWITGANRDAAVEIFTTNYDLLFEQAFEAVKAPYFDGFTGGRQPFFDPVTIARSDLPSRWTRLWKLHGSLGWVGRKNGEVYRTGSNTASHLVFPEHLKYDQTQKAPYAAMFDRLRAFLSIPDTLLISIGFSFRDAHITARVDEALAGNPSASVFAFQFKPIAEETCACTIAKRRSNFSVYCPDEAVVNGTRGRWVVPSELPSKDWGPIRATYWASPDGKTAPAFLLGNIEAFGRFFAASRSLQAFSASPTLAAAPTVITGAVTGV